MNKLKYFLASYILGGTLFVIMAVLLFIFDRPAVLFNPLVWIALPVFTVVAYPFVKKNLK